MLQKMFCVEWNVMENELPKFDHKGYINYKMEL